MERGRLRMFAAAIGETDPIYTDVEAARAAGHPDLPVPPTFSLRTRVWSRPTRSAGSSSSASTCGVSCTASSASTTTGSATPGDTSLPDQRGHRHHGQEGRPADPGQPADRRDARRPAGRRRCTASSSSATRRRARDRGPRRPGGQTRCRPLTVAPITRTTLALFAGASGDHNPIHIDIDAGPHPPASTMSSRTACSPLPTSAGCSPRGFRRSACAPWRCASQRSPLSLGRAHLHRHRDRHRSRTA